MCLSACGDSTQHVHRPDACCCGHVTTVLRLGHSNTRNVSAVIQKLSCVAVTCCAMCAQELSSKGQQPLYRLLCHVYVGRTTPTNAKITMQHAAVHFCTRGSSSLSSRAVALFSVIFQKVSGMASCHVVLF